MKENLRHFIASTILMAVAISVGTLQLRAQAAAEYTLGTAKAATGAAGFGNIMNRSLSKAAGKISDNLKTSIHESPARVMQENRSALEKLASEGGGTLHVTSDPDDAAVFVDGRLVARTPAEIKTPTGKHQIMVTRPDRDQWTKQVTIAKGQTLEISAELVNTNPSVISLDFPDSKKQ
jgi:selenocysteine lyase/cysteine desulfurase